MEGLLALGGMGEIYLGFDQKLRRRVAVKTLRAEQRLVGEARARFLREARLLSRLEHPALCAIHDLIETPDADFLILERIEGETLRSAQAGALSPDRRLALAQQIAEALAVAHREQIVHRDLKPDNVMVTPDGSVKVLDFGIARDVLGEAAVQDLASGEPQFAGDPDSAATSAGIAGAVESGPEAEPASASRLTRQGAVVGTLRYMSPEQARGFAATPHSDMYSFGLLLHELLTGEPAYPPAARVTLADVAAGRTRPPSGLAPEPAALIRALTALDPLARPGASEAAATLAAIRDRPRQLRRRRLLRLAAAATAAALVITTVVVTALALAADRARREADSRRVQAESLIAFTLGDLARRLESVGRLDVLDDASRRALEYFDAVPEAQLTDGELRRRVDANVLVASVRRRRGDLDGALAAAREAEALALRLVTRAPQSVEAHDGTASAALEAGQVLYDRRELDLALQAWTRAGQAADRAAALAPEDPRLQRRQAAAWHDLGTLREARLELRAAREAYERSIRANRVAAARLPRETELDRELATTLAWMGSVQERLGDLDGSLAARRRHLELQERLAAVRPDDASGRFDVGVAHLFLARLLAVRDDPEALTHFARGRRIVEELSKADEANADWAHYVGLALADEGAACVQRGQDREGAALLSRALAHFTRLAARNPAVRRNLAAPHASLAEALQLAADPGAAGLHARQAEELLRVSVADDPAAGRPLAEVLLLRAALDPEGRQQRLAEAEALLRTSAEPDHWRTLVAWARLDVQAGRLEAARPRLARLGALRIRPRSLAVLARRAGLTF